MASTVLGRMPYNLGFESREALKAHPQLSSYPFEMVDADNDVRELVVEVLRRKKVPVAYLYDVPTDRYKVFCEPEDKA